MRKWLILLMLVTIPGPQLAHALTISGTVTLGGAAFPNVQMLAPKAACAATDALGNYACQVPSGWSGTLAPYSNGWTFVVAGDAQKSAAATFTTLAANVPGQNFNAAPAYGLRAELALHRAASSLLYLDYNFDGTPDSTVVFGLPTDIALAGDVNGDGISDLVLFRNGVWYASTHQDGVVDMTFGFGAPGDVPLLCDFDGDGTADLVVFRNGTWYVSTQRNGVVDKVYHFGQAGDVPLCGDFNADGIADLALYRNGVWYIDTHRTTTVDVTVHFGGAPGDIPLLFDFDGDGKADLCIFRNGTWYVNTKLDGTVQAAWSYGGATDVPLAWKE